MRAQRALRVPNKVFFDSDVLVMAHKSVATRSVLHSRVSVERAWRDRSGVVSTSVLQSFFHGIRSLRHSAFTPAQAKKCIEDYLTWHVVVSDILMLMDAMERDERDGVPVDIGLVVQAALAGGASVIYSYRVPLDIGDASIRVVRPNGKPLEN